MSKAASQRLYMQSSSRTWMKTNHSPTSPAWQKQSRPLSYQADSRAVHVSTGKPYFCVTVSEPEQSGDDCTQSLKGLGNIPMHESCILLGSSLTRLISTIPSLIVDPPLTLETRNGVSRAKSCIN